MDPISRALAALLCILLAMLPAMMAGGAPANVMPNCSEISGPAGHGKHEESHESLPGDMIPALKCSIHTCCATFGSGTVCPAERVLYEEHYASGEDDFLPWRREKYLFRPPRYHFIHGRLHRNRGRI
jgi:hypothetical protein